ncbi:MAG: DMT family transporter [Nitratireductor sp.]|nr:DMT family transporter [Nitratireductor sp.]
MNDNASREAASAAALFTPSALRGVLLVLFSVFLFAVMDTMTKHLATRYNVPLVAAMRYAINLALLMAVFTPRHGLSAFRTRRTGLAILRGLSLVVSTLCAGLALQRLPVGETIAIIYLAPFGVLLFAGRMLGERVGLAGWLAAIAGFAGVVLIARPGGGLSGAGVGFALMCAAFSVVYHLLSRLLAQTETTHSLLLWAGLAGAAVFGALLPWSWQGPAPGALDIALFLMVGVLATGGHFLFTAAYRHAPASLLAPVNYAHLLWAGLLGWVVFDHVPDGWAMLGMALVALAGGSMAMISHFARARPLTP